MTIIDHIIYIRIILNIIYYILYIIYYLLFIIYILYIIYYMGRFLKWRYPQIIQVIGPF